MSKGFCGVASARVSTRLFYIPMASIKAPLTASLSMSNAIYEELETTYSPSYWSRHSDATAKTRNDVHSIEQ